MSLLSKLETIKNNLPAVHQAGKDAQLRAMWDFYQQGGERTDYLSAFTGVPWDKDSFKPMYDMQPVLADMMFFWFNMPLHPYPDEIPDPIDLVEQLNECGVTLDFSKCTQFWRAFSYAYVSHVGVIDFAKCPHIESYQDKDGNDYADGEAHEVFPTKWGAMFRGSYITDIDKLIFNHLNPSFDSKWLPEGLVNVTCEGTIVHGGLDFSPCENITRESIMQFFNVLADFTTENWSAWKPKANATITLGETNAAKLTDADKAVATGKGWTLL